MPRTEEHVSAAEKAVCTCDPCKRKKGLPHAVHSGVIHSYSSRPTMGWAVRRTTAELADGSTAPTFGIELETSVPDVSVRPLPGEPMRPRRVYGDEGYTDAELAANLAARDAHDEWYTRNELYRTKQYAKLDAEQNLTADEAVSTALPRGLWHAKHDGSVSGPEFASHPATLAYWRLARPHVTAMMKALLHGGMRSHDGDTCGLHVNIGTDAFTAHRTVQRTMWDGIVVEEQRKDVDATAAHLERFARLVTMNPRWSTRMSQRTHSSVSHWSPITGYLDADYNRERWARDIAQHGSAGQNRYCVLNAENEGRVEFRLPRGTLRVDRFYAKLEWTAAMVEYTRDGDNAVQISAFMRWCDKSGEYPALVSFMRERFSAERFGEVAS